MKKKSLSLIITLTSFLVQAQLPVSHLPENKNVVIEEYTGINCGACPDGHRISEQIKNTYPNDVSVINIHTGYYAGGTGDPNYRTSFGDELFNQTGGQGFPTGTVNRHIFYGNQTAIPRFEWENYSNVILGQASYCNVALEANIDVQTREMTINVEVYYTSNGAAENRLNIALLQNNIEGPQAGGAIYNPSQILPNGHYNHMHMLRHLITGQWGDLITTTSQGTLVQRQYTYTLPNDINGVDLKLEDLTIVGFIAEGHQEIITGSEGVINFSNLQYNNNIKIISAQTNSEICNPDDLNAKVKVINYGNNTINSFTLNYFINNGQVFSTNYNITLQPFSYVIVDIPSFVFNVQNTNILNVEAVINGVNDEDISDNNIVVPNIHKTNNSGSGTEYILNLTQDRYGSETTWKIVDYNGNNIASGGPYQNLTNSNTLTHSINITINNSGCYKFIIYDSLGDGINGSYGNGHYNMKESNTGHTVFSGNGQFFYEETSLFEITNTNSIDNNFLSNIKVYPNPVNGQLTIENSKNSDLFIYDLSGKKLRHFNKLPSNTKIDLGFLPNGTYMAKFVKNRFTIRKLIIISR